MAQSTSSFTQEGHSIDHTPGSAVTGGNIVVVNSVPLLATKDIDANALGSLRADGVWEIPKVTGSVSALAAVYWDEDGSPVTGDASSGAATTTATGNLYLGLAVAAADSGDETVKVLRNIATAPSYPALTVTSVAAAGSAQGDAAALAAGFNVVSAADDTKGVKLPAATAGAIVYVKSTVADKILKVYPATGDVINALSANAAISLASGPTPAIFVAADTTTWYTFPLLPS